MSYVCYTCGKAATVISHTEMDEYGMVREREMDATLSCPHCGTFGNVSVNGGKEMLFGAFDFDD